MVRSVTLFGTREALIGMQCAPQLPEGESRLNSGSNGFFGGFGSAVYQLAELQYYQLDHVQPAGRIILVCSVWASLPLVPVNVLVHILAEGCLKKI